MADYLLQEDGSSKFILENSSGDILLESSVLGVAPGFISSVTAVHAPNVYYASSITVSTAGTYSWLCPPGITTVEVSCYGGGGGGGLSSDGGGAGGGGAFARRVSVPVTPGAVYTFVVGAHGAGAASSGVHNDGTDSTFTGDSGTQVIAKGGSGGLNTAGGTAGQASGSTGDGGLVFSGGNGGTGFLLSSNCGGGGASGNTLATGAVGGNATALTGGAGGTGANGGGSGGHGFSGTSGGTAGVSPGGGGGGGSISGPSSALSGADGSVVITTYATFTMPFKASTTVVYAARTNPQQIAPSFIASATVVYTPQLPRQIAVPFISSHTLVYTPRVLLAFTGAAVSQVVFEVATNDSTAPAQVSQVTLEIVVPWYRGAHVWVKTGQTGG